MTLQPGRAAGRVVLLTRPGCHLCGPVRDVIRQVCGSAAEPWSEVDVDSDPELAAEYGDLIPVVLVDGTQVASHRLDAVSLQRALAAGR